MFGEGFEELEDSKGFNSKNLDLGLMDSSIFALGRHEVQLERVNPSPYPTHSARESESTQVETILHSASGCSRGSHLIR
ncbi:hypothetical protein H5410_060996, partial [Solanum commersonii]